MEKAAYLLKNIYRMFGLAGRMFDAKGKPLAVSFPGFEKEDPVLCSPELLAALQKAGQGEPGGYRAYSDGGYWYYVLCRTECCIVWGLSVLRNTRNMSDVCTVKSAVCGERES